MSDVTQILRQIECGDPSAPEDLLPLVYAELRRLAAGKMAQESPGQTLQATALVHDAYVRLVLKQAFSELIFADSGQVFPRSVEHASVAGSVESIGAFASS